MSSPVRTETDDLGLFGPDSVTWRVHGDIAMGPAGIRALLMQAVHPLAMAGVAEHSDYRGDPWGRLQRTGGFIGAVTYGTTAEAKAAGARVRKIHSRLAGIEPESGQAYRVSDPHLLRWIHVCEAESFLTTFRRSGGHLAPGDADRYYAEMQQSAALVGCPDVPTDEAAIYAYLDDMRPELRVTHAARDAARFIIAPPLPGWVSVATPARPALLALSGLGIALLPRWVRRLYRLPGLPSTDLGATIAARGVRGVAGLLPESIRTGPHYRAAQARIESQP